jgi:TatD DNase family protein
VQKPIFTDTHCHIYSTKFANDRAEAIRRAVDAGIHRILMPNVDLESYNQMMQVAAGNPGVCYPMLGLHPCSVDANFNDVLNTMWENQNDAQWVGIGETGIDLYWDKTYLAEQKEALKIQATWAIALDLPLILHVRNAFDEVFELLDEVNCPALKGVFHCFSGNAQQAERATSYGDFYLGIGGVVTYKNGGLDDALKDIPLDVILLETDAPYLSPEPHRGKGSRNEPACVVHVADKLCSIYRCSIQHLSQQTETNVNKLFKHAI